MATQNIALEIRDVKKSFGKNEVLKTVNLDVHEGEFIVLLGPSGCGKTTLLNAVIGLGRPDGGSITLRGKNITNLPTNKRDIGIVFQSYALFPHMTVKQNVAFGLRMRKMPKAEIDKKVEEGLARVHLAGYENRKITEMSGGQRQRVALARALVLQPALLLMDEPLSNLDAKLRASVRVEIAQITRSMGITTIMVTHDQVEAMTMADRIVLLQDGIIQQNASPVEIYENPANLFVAGFVGSPSVNQLSLRFEKGQFVADELETVIAEETMRQMLNPQQKNATFAQGEYILGVRPEHFWLDSEQAVPLGNGTIGYQEVLGSETVLHIDMGKTRLKVLIEGIQHELGYGQNVKMGVEQGRAHLFTKDGGHRI